MIVVLTRVVFVCWLVALFLLGFASLIAYPGPFVLTAFSLGGLPLWVLVHRRRWAVALALAVLASALPAFLLITYSHDGDFTTQSAARQIVFLGFVAFALAWLGMAAGKFVWLTPKSPASA